MKAPETMASWGLDAPSRHFGFVPRNGTGSARRPMLSSAPPNHRDAENGFFIAARAAKIVARFESSFFDVRCLRPPPAAGRLACCAPRRGRHRRRRSRRRPRHPQFRQCGHRRRRQGGVGDHRPQLRRSTPRSRARSTSFRRGRFPRASCIRRCSPRSGCRAWPRSRATASPSSCWSPRRRCTARGSAAPGRRPAHDPGHHAAL